jgi:hypothetical protein
MLGAKVGTDVFINTGSIGCFDLLEIGDGVAIGDGAVLIGVDIAGGRTMFDKTIIRENATVGTNCVLSPGAILCIFFVLFLFDKKWRDASWSLIHHVSLARLLKKMSFGVEFLLKKSLIMHHLRKSRRQSDLLFISLCLPSLCLLWLFSLMRLHLCSILHVFFMIHLTMIFKKKVTYTSIVLVEGNYSKLGAFWLLILAVPLNLVVLISYLMLVVTAKWSLLGKMTERTETCWSSYFFRYAIFNMFVDLLFPLFKQ